MRGYLFDTNHLDAIFRNDEKVKERLKKVPPENYPRVSAITLGEIEAGHIITNSTDQMRRDEFIAFINEFFLPYSLDVTFTTRLNYAEIMGVIFKNNPIPPRRGTERHLVDLGVDINDIWIASVAYEKNMGLVTNDKMTCIREALNGKVEFDDWL